MAFEITAPVIKASAINGKKRGSQERALREKKPMLSNTTLGVLTALFSVGIYAGVLLAGYFAGTLLKN